MTVYSVMMEIVLCLPMHHQELLPTHGILMMKTDPAQKINTSHSFYYYDFYMVKLTATNDDGCWDTISKKMVVLESPYIDIVLEDDSTQCLAGNSFTFYYASESNSNHFWILMMDSQVLLQVYHDSYASPGTYEVKYVGTSNDGCSDSTTQTVVVYPQPAADFSVNDSIQCYDGNSFAFTNASSGATSYSWDFNDEGGSSATNPTHSFYFPDYFMVKLTATNDDGCWDTISKKMVVLESPYIDIVLEDDSTQCLAGNSFTFYYASESNSNHFWDFDDGFTSTSSGLSHSYASPGTYEVKYVGTSNDGCSDSTTQTVVVYPQPAADFSVNDSIQCYDGNSFAFTNASSGATSYSWDFNDEGGSSATNPTHSFYFPDYFMVKLTATNDDGCWDTISKKMVVPGISLHRYSFRG